MGSHLTEGDPMSNVGCHGYWSPRFLPECQLNALLRKYLNTFCYQGSLSHKCLWLHCRVSDRLILLGKFDFHLIHFSKSNPRDRQELSKDLMRCLLFECKMNSLMFLKQIVIMLIIRIFGLIFDCPVRVLIIHCRFLSLNPSWSLQSTSFAILLFWTSTTDAYLARFPLCP